MVKNEGKWWKIKKINEKWIHEEKWKMKKNEKWRKMMKHDKNEENDEKWRNNEEKWREMMKMKKNEETSAKSHKMSKVLSSHAKSSAISRVHRCCCNCFRRIPRRFRDVFPNVCFPEANQQPNFGESPFFRGSGNFHWTWNTHTLPYENRRKYVLGSALLTMITLSEKLSIQQQQH